MASKGDVNMRRAMKILFAVIMMLGILLVLGIVGGAEHNLLNTPEIISYSILAGAMMIVGVTGYNLFD